MPPLLEVRAITKRFPGVVALREVCFDLRPGEIHALCGENGAGKSTLIKLLSGLYPHGTYEGEWWLRGQPARLRGVNDASRHGIAVIHQELTLVEELSIAENLFLGDEPRRGWRLDWERIWREAEAVLTAVGLALPADAPVSALGVGQKQLVEIAKALRKNAEILILDEPTAALTGQEVEILLARLRPLRARGIACIYISHKLEEVFALADRITVLRDGASILTAEARRLSPHDVIRHMVGREIRDFFPRVRSAPGEALLRVRGLTVRENARRAPRLHDLDFEVRAGEVLGIGGLMGAGRSELLLHLLGAWGERVRGEVELRGRPFRPRSPTEAVAAGLVLVSEDRKRYGLILEKSVGFNLSLSTLPQLQRGGLIDRDREAHLSQGLCKALRVKAPSLDTPVGTLSGGNQQKVVLGKALMTGPRVVLLDEPTRGIDIGAKLEVYELINRLTAEGQAVVLVSSELPELMGMSDRILMLAAGRKGGEFTRDQATPEALVAAALATPPDPSLLSSASP